MANTYTQLYFHIVFAVKFRKNQIAEKWKNDLYKYITGIIANKNQKLMYINGMPNHIHLLISTKPDCNLSDLIRDVKSSSSKWINDNQYVSGRFQWQLGFGAFTVSQSGVDQVINYIKYQEKHHLQKTFQDEYIDLLKKHEIEFKSEYIFSEE